jgi:hypothetical protein
LQQQQWELYEWKKKENKERKQKVLVILESVLSSHYLIDEIFIKN